MKGVEVEDKSGIRIIRVHYTADTEKAKAKWQTQARAGMPDWQWDKEYEIDFGAAGGSLVYDMWDSHIHMVKPFTIPKTWTRYGTLDLGRRSPTVCLLAAVNKNGDVYFYDCYYVKNAPHTTHIKNIAHMLRGQKFYRFFIPHDSKNLKHDEYNRTLFDDYQDEFDDIKPRCVLSVGTTDKDSGIKSVSSYLLSSLARRAPDNEYWEKHSTPGHVKSEIANKPAVFFFQGKMKPLQNEIRKLRWEEHSVKAGERNPKERIRKFEDHACDALWLLLVNKPKYRGYVKQPHMTDDEGIKGKSKYTREDWF